MKKIIHISFKTINLRHELCSFLNVYQLKNLSSLFISVLNLVLKKLSLLFQFQFKNVIADGFSTRTPSIYHE